MPRHCNKSATVLLCVGVAAILGSFAFPRALFAQTGTTTFAEDSNSSTSAPTKVYLNGWAGYILYSPNSQPLKIPHNRFYTIGAEWVVPSAQPSINCDLMGWLNTGTEWEKEVVEPLDGSSIWLGIDGWMSTYQAPNGSEYGDVLQAGTETNVNCWSGKPTNQDCNGTLEPACASFWIEWNGTANIPVNWPADAVRVGDRIHVTISAKTDGPQAWRQAEVELFNITTARDYNSGWFDSGCLVVNNNNVCQNPPGRGTLFGFTAEWVVETDFNGVTYCTTDPKDDGNCPKSDTKVSANSVSNFGTVQMTNMSVTDDHGNVYTPGNPGEAGQYIDWMTVTGNGPVTEKGSEKYAPGNALLACAAITGPQAITLTRAPYEITTLGEQGDIKYKPLSCDKEQPAAF
jgi:hypothetical protein